jgi:hypothetical protein
MDTTTKRGIQDARSSKRMIAENKREILFDAYVKRTWWWPKRRLFYYRDPDTVTSAGSVLERRVNRRASLRVRRLRLRSSTRSFRLLSCWLIQPTPLGRLLRNSASQRRASSARSCSSSCWAILHGKALTTLQQSGTLTTLPRANCFQHIGPG